MKKPANKIPVNIMFFLLLATLALMLMGTILTKPVSNELNSTAQQFFAESSASADGQSKNLQFSNPGAILRANAVK